MIGRGGMQHSAGMCTHAGDIIWALIWAKRSAAAKNVLAFFKAIQK
jgi:hypothetical protein